MILFLSFCTLTAILVVVCVKLRVGEPDVVSKLHTLLRREKCYVCMYEVTASQLAQASERVGSPMPASQKG